MYKKITIIITLFFCCNFIFAQDENTSVLTNVQALRVAFITKDLDLSTEEAQKFWPVYNKYIGEIKKAKQESGEDVLVFEERLLNIKKSYTSEFKKVLSTENRVNKVYGVDRKFSGIVKKELLRRQQLNRNGGMGLKKFRNGGPGNN